MRITARTFASLRELSVDRCELELGSPATVDDAWSALQVRFPALEPQRPYVRAARNGAYVAWSEPVAEGDVVAFLPPVSGGASSLTEAPIDVAALERIGGRARGWGRSSPSSVVPATSPTTGGPSSSSSTRRTPRWPTRSWMRSAPRPSERFGVACAVVHRSGLVPIGEAAVAIVTAARHRAEAYEANRFVIEAIKERLPIWKRERFADGSEWKRPGA